MFRPRDPKRGCVPSDPSIGSLRYGKDYGYQYNVPVSNEESQSRRGFSLCDFMKEMLTGAVTGGMAGATFYGAGRAVSALKESVKPIEQMPSRQPQTYTADLSNVTGKGARARNKAIEAIIKEDFPDLKLTYEPEYSPFIRTGVAQRNSGTQIGKNMFSSRADLRDTIIHEELHHRWWQRGIIDHHPLNSSKEEIFYKTLSLYKQMRGWN